MVKTLEIMAKNYDAKVPVFSKRWVEITPKKRSAFEEGVAKVLGVSPTEIKRGDDWAAGVERAKAYFEDSVRGKGKKLAENYKIAMTTD